VTVGGVLSSADDVNRQWVVIKREYTSVIFVQLKQHIY